MDKKEKKRRNFIIKPDLEPYSPTAKTNARKARGDWDESQSTSHTQFFVKPRHETEFKRVNVDTYLGIPESVSGSSDSYHCVHGEGGKQYTKSGLLKRHLQKELDPIPADSKWIEKCRPSYGWGMAEKLVFLVRDPTVLQQTDRLTAHLVDFAKTTSGGYRAEVLDNVCILMDFLIETLPKKPILRDVFVSLLENLNMPIRLVAASDVMKYFDSIRNFIGFLGYMLMRLEDDRHFDLVSDALIWHLAAPDEIRCRDAAQLRHTLAAAASVLDQTVSRMLAVTTAHRFPTFLMIALLLACDTVDNCVELMKENIIENIFYRFNPYFPERRLPDYDINPANPQDCNIKLGDSSVHMSTTLSLLLVLLKTTKQYLEQNPSFRRLMPCPDEYSQRCFVWAFRYECRARDHHHERNTLTGIAIALLHCFRDRLSGFSSHLMPDVMSLSVLTELPPRADWTAAVGFSILQQDVLFKKNLIHLSVDMLKYFPFNKCMVEDRHWLVGLMYLIDPGLSSLKAHWSPALFAELRKTTLQSLVCALPFTAPNLTTEYGLVRRLMWYIEWYSESPYELSVLYWCLRLLQAAAGRREGPTRRAVVKDLFDTHAVIILIQLCYTLLGQKLPPVEKGQAILALALRLLTSTAQARLRVSCCVYPDIRWPQAVTTLARRMLDAALYSLEKHCIVSDRWLISTLNFIWESIIWKTEYREKFILKDGIYKLLDIITHPCLVKRGATIATLLAAIFRDECKVIGAKLDHNGVLMDLDFPIMSMEVRKELEQARFREPMSMRTPVCLTAADVAGSRLSKAFAILHMLSMDLEHKVAVADDAYNLYKNIKLAPEDESVLVLCSYYLTLKLAETWRETQIQSSGYLPHDEEIFQEFLHIGRGWAKEIKKMQEGVIENDRSKEQSEEYSLYSFLGRVRLNVALDALRQVRCVSRSADRARIAHALLQDAVQAHHRRSVYTKKAGAPVLRTYGPALDDYNMTGQNVKVYSIHPKDKPKPRADAPPS